MNTKIEALRKNIEIVNNTLATFDFSVLDTRDVPSIKEGFEYAREMCRIYLDFENGLRPE